MQNRETSFEKDPHLRRNDSLTQKLSDASGNKWAEAMKGMPSYSEHMKQVEARTTVNHNAFKQATQSKATTPSQSNAFSRTNGPGQNSSRFISNNSIKSASNSVARTSGSMGQSVSRSK